jgi:hypothetical protein
MELIFQQEAMAQLNQQIFVTRTVEGSKNKALTPQIAGSCTGWKTDNMTVLSDFCTKIDSVSKKYRISKDYQPDVNTKKPIN